MMVPIELRGEKNTLQTAKDLIENVGLNERSDHCMRDLTYKYRYKDS